ncbi:tRNA uridine 5-carboxymethylaminomethyl modification enzyme mnmG (gidA) [Candidatus Zinderia insecticola CARI]|uniref:tRNA uridine 5-carboxymethylaminomethyl modification enzyme MnmG n=1 Tax=Zinderia insecticola (strain CARI) TaxID=871271 RepID=E0TIL0_ZINIC|nr:tRNA uridine 5-carboxymethylaminomethyl modification enzyme mnmG (gidA) [Candidatus Zinderia insecticola CARI]
MKFIKKFDVIIIGGGHAGIEAANICSNMNSITLLISNNIELIGELSCNPSIGGIGKSHLVKEIDSLGGIMGICSDESSINFQILNYSKGNAVKSTRVQLDRKIYKDSIINKLKNKKNLFLFQGIIDDIIIEKNIVLGIKTKNNFIFLSKCLIITTGTFFNPLIHIGNYSYISGRLGENLNSKLFEKLKKFGFQYSTLKTGTPPRLDGKSINFLKLKKQFLNSNIQYFSILSDNKIKKKQINCWITNTNFYTYYIIKKNIYQSSLFNGNINSIGPRYCPSIEDKINKFGKKKHKIFLEPEGLNSNEFYPNGISNSLPIEIQIKILRTLNGLENVNITRPGYSIEYNYFIGNHLKHSLESKIISNLFFAGQINGTTGYEEAASQGIIAGINASLKSNNKKKWYPKRYQAYIGVLIDDLIKKKINEPYRIFTTSSEYKLNLREDNVYLRLTEIGRKLKCVKNKQWFLFKKKKKIFKKKIRLLKTNLLTFNNIKNSKINFLFNNIKKKNIYSFFEIINKFKLNYDNFFNIFTNNNFKYKIFENDIKEQIENFCKYYGYYNKQLKNILKINKNKNYKINKNLNYNFIKSLSKEAKIKFNILKPNNLKEALSISGIDFNDILNLFFYIKK